MSDLLGLSIGTTNLVAARIGNQPVTRRSVLTLSTDRTPQVGAPDNHGNGIVLSGFVERIGDPVPLVGADASSYPADRLLVEALDAMIDVVGGNPTSEIAIAVPAHWGSATLWALRNALRTNPNLAPNGKPARLISDAVTSLAALSDNQDLTLEGVVALLDFGGSGTSITLADAESAFESIGETIRYSEFSGDQIDQALLTHVMDAMAQAGGVDPTGTAAVESLARLREECRLAKERLSGVTVIELAAELPGYRSDVQVTRAELENLIAEPLQGVLAALESSLERNKICWENVSAVVTVGGGASIPLVTRLLSEHSRAPVVTTPQPALDAAAGAALLAAYGSAADAETGVAPVAAAGDLKDDSQRSATLRALAWSQDEDSSDEPLPYTGEDPYDTDTTTRPPVQYVPPTGPIAAPQTWQRLPQLVFGLAAVVALLTVGGVAYALTGMTVSTGPSSEVKTAVPTSAEAPPPSPPDPPPVITVTKEAPPPPPPPPPQTTPPPPPPPPQTTTRATTTTTTTMPTTTTTTTMPTTTTTITMPTTTTTTTMPTTTTTITMPTTTPTTTVNPMTTSFLTVPFVPVPIPIQVPADQVQPSQQQAHPPQEQVQAPVNPFQPPVNPFQPPVNPFQPPILQSPVNPFQPPPLPFQPPRNPFWPLVP